MINSLAEILMIRFIYFLCGGFCGHGSFLRPISSAMMWLCGAGGMEEKVS